MGVTDRNIQCPTCGLNELNCPGHPGHLELDYPVYHPLLFASTFQLVRAACSCCHRLRISNARIWPFLAKLKLLEMDDIVGADELNDKLLPPVMFDDIEAAEGAQKEEEPEGEDLDETFGEDEAKGGSDLDEAPSSAAAKGKKKDKGKGDARNAARADLFRNRYDPGLDPTEILAQIDKRFTAYCRQDERSRRPPSVYARNKQEEVISLFNKECQKVRKCELCGERSHAIRKDGYTKLFAKPIPAKFAKIKSKNKLLYGGVTALEYLQAEEKGVKIGGEGNDSDDSDDDPGAMDEDDDDDDDDEEEEEEDEEDEEEGEEKRGDKAGKDKGKDKGKANDRYLAAHEVEAILTLLWRYHPEILDSIYGRATRGLQAMYKPNNSGWKLFFLRTILVPANRFRPEALVGETSSDHPQNLHLARIIEANLAVRKLFQPAQEEEEEASGEGLSLSEMVAAGAATPAKKVTALATPLSSRTPQSLLSQSLAFLIQLQNHVNCYMDSQKDPNPLGGNNTPAGIRQILERKEGLFRKHMMGKRVNYCCRSVISPDNYIGTNEVGIPLHFAKSLHYPEPVNEYNVKHLRTLVERGPFQYPGKGDCHCYCSIAHSLWQDLQQADSTTLSLYIYSLSYTVLSPERG